MTARGRAGTGPGPRRGGPVAGRRSFPWPTLAVVLLVAGPTRRAGRGHPAPAASRRRRLPARGLGRRRLHLGRRNEQVFVLGGSVLIQQDQTSLWSNRAVVWVDVEAYRKREPFAVAVYADENADKRVAIETKGRRAQEVAAAVVEFTSPQFGWVRGRERQESLADSSFYKKALAARGKPAPAPRRRRRRAGTTESSRPNSTAPTKYSNPTRVCRRRRDARRLSRPAARGHRHDCDSRSDLGDADDLDLAADQSPVQRLPVEKGQGRQRDRLHHHRRHQAVGQVHHRLDPLDRGGGRPGHHLAQGIRKRRFARRHVL